MDTSTKADQPFVYETGSHTVYAMCNGEIYSHREFAQKYDLELTTGSDCEVIPLMYKKYGSTGIEIMLNEFDSEHAFMIMDVDRDTGDYTVFFSEDRFGIRPLFIGENEMGIFFSSELIGIPFLNDEELHVHRFKPRHYATLKKINGVLGKLIYTEYYNLKTIVEKLPAITNPDTAIDTIAKVLDESVQIRLHADRPIGCLLSGGLDSSYVSSVAAKHLKANGKKLRTFCVGLKGSTDAPYAQQVADFIGSDHTNIVLGEEDFSNAMEEIIRITGTYDITSVRATTGQYLAAKWVSENTDIKVLLVGDGADEVQLSYLYGHNAPTAKAFHDESIRLTNDIHLFDGLRADRGVAFWGIEVRFPFLYKKYVEMYLSIDAELRRPKNGLEKWLVRDACLKYGLLPTECALRVKEAFSDGVSSHERSWKDIIIEVAEKYMENEKERQIFSHLPPTSAESYMYRKLFTKYYGCNESVAQTIPYFWLPKWCGNVTDPSARVLNVYSTLVQPLINK